MIITLQLIFIKKILYKNCNSKRSKIIKLVKINLKDLIVRIFSIKNGNKVLILVISNFILIILIYLVKICFLIIIHKFLVSKKKCNIIFKYIII